MLLKAGENVVLVSNSLNQGETPSYLASHPNPSCLHNYGTIVVPGGLRVKKFVPGSSTVPITKTVRCLSLISSRVNN